MSRSFYGGLYNGQIRFDEIPGVGPFAGTDFPEPAQRIMAQYQAGTAADQIDGVSYVLLTLAASTPQVIALNSLVDVYGVAITAARLRFACFKNLSGTDGAFVKVGNNGSNDFNGLASSGGTFNVYPSSTLNDGFVVFNAPNTTAAAISGSAYNLKCDPGSTAQNLLVMLATASA